MKVACLFFLGFAWSSPGLWAHAYYVSPSGHDSDPGTLEHPFATLERARQAVQQTPDRDTESTTVYLRAGRYLRTQTFLLKAWDAGTATCPVTYCAYPDEEVTLTGGQVLPPASFTPVTSSSPVWDRLDPLAQGQCLMLDLKSLGLTQVGEALQAELSFNDIFMPLARWPNQGFVRTTSAANDITFGYDDLRPRRWTHAPEAYGMGYWRYGWSNRIARIARIDTVNKKITLEKAPVYGIATNKPYYVVNLLEEIDQPGEWYLDRQAGVLYFWPPDKIDQADIILSTLAEPIISLKDVSYVHIEGLILEMGMDHGIDVQGGRDNRIDHCMIRNIRKNAINLSGQRNTVTHGEIYGIGQAGVVVSGGDRTTLEPGENAVYNCTIHDFGRWQRTYAPAIKLSGVGNLAVNNSLYDAPHSAILFSGNDHLIALNEIHDVCYEVDDAGSIYGGRDWGMRGNVIRNNFIHDIKSRMPGGSGVQGVYLDDCASGITVFGNVFYKITGRAVMCGGGRDNTLENNVIAKCGSAFFTDRRGTVWIDKDQQSWNLLTKIKRYHYTQPPWSEHYPKLAHILDNGYDQAKEPEGCVIARNLGWQNQRWLEENCLGGCGGFKFYTIQDNIKDQDPLFVDETNLNFKLRDDSPAYSIPGFQPIPFDQIGPR